MIITDVERQNYNKMYYIELRAQNADKSCIIRMRKTQVYSIGQLQ